MSDSSPPCSLDTSLLRETNHLARETSRRVGDMSIDLARHLVDCNTRNAAVATIAAKVGELAANADMTEAKMDSIAKRVHESLVPTLEPIMHERAQLRRAVVRAKKVGIVIASAVITASAIYYEALPFVSPTAKVTQK